MSADKDKQDLIEKIVKADIEKVQGNINWDKFDEGLLNKLSQKAPHALLLDKIASMVFNTLSFLLKPQIATAFVLMITATFVYKNINRNELSIEDEIYIQEMLLLSELGEDIDLPSTSEEIQEDYQMIQSINI